MQGACEGSYSVEGSASKHLLGAFYEMLPSKNLVFTENPYSSLLRNLLLNLVFY